MPRACAALEVSRFRGLVPVNLLLFRCVESRASLPAQVSLRMPKFSSLALSAEPTLAARAARSAAALRARLERRVVGQGPLKDALVLSLVSKEHLYVEGPPGIGKTALAEAACAASGRRSFFAQLHRDTRLSELIGDAVIRR